MPKMPQGAIHAVATASAHLPEKAVASFHTISLSPVRDLVHKAVAVAFALLLTIGTYAFVDPEAARSAAHSFQNAYVSLKNVDTKDIALRTSAQLAAAAQ